MVETLPGFGGGQLLPFPIAYAAKVDLFDASVRFRVTDRLKVGGAARLRDTEGSFPLQREDLSAMVELGVGEGYLVHVEYRSIDYNEVGIDFDDYDARILEVGLGYSW